MLFKRTRHSALGPGGEDAFRRECERLDALRSRGVARLLASDAASGTLILEDVGAALLETMLKGGGFDLDAFFGIARSLCETVVEIHRQGLCRLELDPRRILVHPTQLRTQLFDLGSACEKSDPSTDETLPDRLTYCAPERTGRVRRAVDHRADLYSLGSVFYELLSGRPLYGSEDALELVHAHLARRVAFLADVAPAVPRQLSLVVEKLLAKTPEERYQSAWGLAHDLDRCATEWKERGAIASFPLGARDLSDQFEIPRRLYGREDELRALLEAYDEARRGPVVFTLLAGPPGVGKTSLVLEARASIARRRGRLVSGKFDPLDRRTPYDALVQALRALVLHVMGEEEERLEGIRSRLTGLRGVHAGVLGSILPELELLVGRQPPAPPLHYAEAQNLLPFVLESFLEVFATPERPLALFLDDLQWADPATLQLLMHLASGTSVRHLLVIGAYRDSDVGAEHDLAKTVAAIRASGARVAEIRISALATRDLEQLVADTLHCEPERVTRLARLVGIKTGSNPFFVSQFLGTLHADGLLEFDHRARRWTFDLDRIEGAGITDNVVELMTHRLRRLAPRTREVVTSAACFGGRFHLGDLARLSERAESEVESDLREAVEAGLVVPSSDGSGRRAASAGRGMELAFLHDRVQQAAYAWIDLDRRRALHLRIGRQMLASGGAEVPDEILFDTVHHLDLARELIEEAGERLRLVRLNQRSGRRARESAAFAVALEHFEIGLELLPEDAWETHYELATSLSLEHAECSYLCGRYDAAERSFEAVMQRARSPLERAEAHRIRLVQHEGMARYAEALSDGREALRLLGVDLPCEASEIRAALTRELAVIEDRRGARPIASLEELRTLEDPETRMLVELLTSMWPSAYILGQAELAFLLSARIVGLSLEHGNTASSAFGYVTHAISVGPVCGDYASAYEWGSLALRVNDRFGDKQRRAKIHQQFNAHVTLWRRPVETCIQHAREACRSGLEAGDFNYAGYGAFTESWAALFACRDLERFVREYEPTVALLERIRMKFLAEGQELLLCWARALQGRTADPLSLDCGSFSEDRYARTWAENGFCLTFLHVARLQLGVLFDAPVAALESAHRVRSEGWAPAGTIWPVLLEFWGGLAWAAFHGRASGAEQDRARRQLAAARDALQPLAESAPENFRCMHLLLGAELARIEGEFGVALEQHEQAIRYAQETENLQMQALASELCARMWLARGRPAVAAPYARDAHRTFARWGAHAKVAQLETFFGQLLRAEQGVEPKPSTSRSLDAATALKAAQAIVAETDLARLLQALVRISIESAGAERGMMLQERDGRWVVVAEGTAGEARVQLTDEPLEARADLSHAIVLLAHRTGESVIVDDAREDRAWIDERYAEAVDPRAILCTPIVHQGRRAGLFYFDNRATPGSFDRARVEVMRVLSAQAAIALENARLVLGMREEIDRRSRAEEALQGALRELEELKDRLQDENLYLQEEIRTQANFEEIVGASRPLIQVLERVEQVADTDTTVLVLGETGTGKELIARALHSRSRRAARPLVKVNCGAIPAGLVESELFGHVKGAFTGALQSRVGRFELADGGTIFLDEVGELPLDTQVKLLRVLQESEFEPVGGSRTVRVDLRVIAATNRDLERAVREGRFRADLLYRLNVFPIRVPPLRERPGDVPLIVSFFLTDLAKKLGKPLTGFSRRSMDRLLAYDWPGNARELENVVQRAAIVARGPVLEIDADPLGEAAAGADAGPCTLAEMERRHVIEALRRSAGVIEGARGAARVLGLHPNTLRSRLKKLGIERSDYEGS